MRIGPAGRKASRNASSIRFGASVVKTSSGGVSSNGPSETTAADRLPTLKRWKAGLVTRDAAMFKHDRAAARRRRV
jgi:hypothetical protein